MGARKPPSIARIISVDYLTQVGAGLFVAAIVLLGYAWYRDISITAAYGWLNLLIVLFLTIGIVFVSRRIITIRSLFHDGIAVPAVINKVWFIRRRGRVEYSYTFQGDEYQGWHPIAKSRFTRFLRPKKKVTLLVDGNDPKRALIRELYE